MPQIPSYPELSSPASGDWLYVVDISDTTDSNDGSSKKVTAQNIADLVTTELAFGS